MKMDNLSVRTAQWQVQNYQQECADLLAKYRGASPDDDIEAFLQLGIESFHWLMRADRAARAQAARAEISDWSSTEADLRALCRHWSEASEFAGGWILQQGAEPVAANLKRFRECVAEMDAIAKFESHRDAAHAETLTSPAVHLRDEALREYQNGETAEFF